MSSGRVEEVVVMNIWAPFIGCGVAVWQLAHVVILYLTTDHCSADYPCLGIVFMGVYYQHNIPAVYLSTGETGYISSYNSFDGVNSRPVDG